MMLRNDTDGTGLVLGSGQKVHTGSNSHLDSFVRVVASTGRMEQQVQLVSDSLKRIPIQSGKAAEIYPGEVQTVSRPPFPPVPRIEHFLQAGEVGQDLGWRLPQPRQDFKPDQVDGPGLEQHQLNSWARHLGPPLAHSHPAPVPVHSDHFVQPTLPHWQQQQFRER